jgi:DNA-binding transcriptional ArsR family regulator
VVEVPDVRGIVDQMKARIAHIEDQLKRHSDLSAELDRLRDALGRLEGDVRARARGRGTPAKAKPSPTRTTTARKAAPATKRAAAPSKPREAATAAPRGQTRAKVLEALKDGPKTAGEVAEATGVARGTASTTLNKLARSGEVVKADRGYKLPESG